MRLPSPVIDQLRQRIERLAAPRRRRDALAFGLGAIDRVLPDGGLAFGALHEVAGGGNGAVHGAAAALFAAGVAARTYGKVLWCLTRPDLFAPAVAQAGLSSSRVIYVECGDDKTVTACFEEGLRHKRLGAVVAEVARLSMTASRRLQLAAETSGTIGIAIRRWRRQTEAADFGQAADQIALRQDRECRSGFRHRTDAPRGHARGVAALQAIRLAAGRRLRCRRIGPDRRARQPCRCRSGLPLRAHRQ